MNRVLQLAASPDARVARFDHPAGLRHRDPHCEIASAFSVNIVEHGSFSVAYGSTVHRLAAGDAFLTFPGMEYRTLHDSAEPDDACLSLSFRPGYERDYGNRVRRAITPGAPMVRRDPRLEYLRHRLKHVQQGNLTEVEALAADVTAAAFDERDGRLWKRAEVRWYAERVDAARQHMRRRLTEDHRLTELARLVGMSPFHFARIFRALTGMPPHRYLLAARMQHAHALLRSGATVTDAAIAAGYDDFSHFSRSFRRHFGEAPSQLFRRRN